MDSDRQGADLHGEGAIGVGVESLGLRSGVDHLDALAGTLRERRCDADIASRVGVRSLRRYEGSEK
ncbi:hypothetical protein GT755_00230 [Herbidospora sp. NEAU-GS84]|uniref:Uncharacterized protein n=1 Tax=Herbidospora solisilvae TaxID=2696284 RepID=A0A7C9IZR7_9ACTN|nr:hypothetical protein [Herbidospora solisilvae]NAS20106.1 hypothetical protein [Herbidospora solisilvae]